MCMFPLAYCRSHNQAGPCLRSITQQRWSVYLNIFGIFSGLSHCRRARQMAPIWMEHRASFIRSHRLYRWVALVCSACIGQESLYLWHFGAKFTVIFHWFRSKLIGKITVSPTFVIWMAFMSPAALLLKYSRAIDFLCAAPAISHGICHRHDPSITQLLSFIPLQHGN